jgi:hypothetical protein
LLESLAVENSDMAHSARHPLLGASAVSVMAMAGRVGSLVVRDRVVALLPLRRLPLGGGSVARGTLIPIEPALLRL